jgi:GTP cyclohydrolase II
MKEVQGRTVYSLYAAEGRGIGWSKLHASLQEKGMDTWRKFISDFGRFGYTAGSPDTADLVAQIQLMTNNPEGGGIGTVFGLH